MADLVTLEDYKDWEGITASKDDLRLQAMVTSVSQLVKTYCARTFIDYYTTEKTETISLHWDSPSIQLDEFPINAITSVQEKQNDAYVLLTEDVDYVFDTSTDTLFRCVGNWASGPNSVRVVYTGGYPACPEDLKLAIYDLITYYYKNEHKQRQQIAATTIENNGTTSVRNSTAFPDHIQRVLDLYRNI